MREKRTRGLWIAAALLAALTVAAVLVDPTEFGNSPETDELATLVEKAATYYDFEHYDRAAETYALAAEHGLDDGVEWYRYARSVELSRGPDLAKFVTAYRLLLQQQPLSDELREVEAVLRDNALPFDYVQAEDGEYAEGALLVATGTVARVKRGLVESGVDTLLVDTKPNDWFRYMGETVRVVAPRNIRYQSGDVVTAIGWYDGWCELNDGAGLSTRYPCIIAAGVVSADRQ